MDNQFGKVLYFVGIGGISMSSLAAIAKINDHIVYGSDRKDSKLIGELRDLGIEIFIGQKKENIDKVLNLYPAKEITAVVTSAISNSNPEIIQLENAGVTIVSRAVFLGQLMKKYSKRIGVSGTHGKSTTTAMVDLILESNNSNPTMLEGALTKETNKAYKIGDLEYFVFEACEYCNSFLSFFPTTAIVTNVDYDHADFFPTVEDYILSFKKYISLSEIAVVNYDSKNCMAACEGYEGKLITCSIQSSNADYCAKNISTINGFPSFDVYKKEEKICHINLSVPGEHNIQNSLVAAVACLENGCKTEAIEKGLSSFVGIKRRMELIKEANGIKYYDDYAHHPIEIKASLAAAKAIGGRIICVFQPHSLSRTAALFDDFVGAFDNADILLLSDVYENLEQDQGDNTVGSKDLSAKIKNSKYFNNFDSIVSYIKEIEKPGDIVIVMGAGDINKIEELL